MYSMLLLIGGSWRQETLTLLVKWSVYLKLLPVEAVTK
jgi:hypothetical protein